MKQKLIDIARKNKILDADALEHFLDQHDPNDKLIDVALLESGLFTEEAILKLFGKYLGVPVVEQIVPARVPAEFVADVPAPYAHRHSLIAVEKDNSTMTVATSYPLGFYPLDNVSKMVGCTVKCALATRTAISTAINAAYEQRATVLEEVAGEVDAQNIESLLGDQGVTDRHLKYPGD